MASQSVDDFLNAPVATPSGGPVSQSVDDFLGTPTATATPSTSPTSASPILHDIRLVGQKTAQGFLDAMGMPDALMESFRQLQPALPRMFSQPANDGVTFAAPTPPVVDPVALSRSIGIEEPQGNLESILAGAAHGLGGAVPALLFGGASAPLTTLTSGALGGVGGESARELGWPSWAQALAGLVPGLAVGGYAATRAAANETQAATQGLEAASTRVNDLQRQVESARITNPLLADLLSQQLRDAKAAAKSAVSGVTASSVATRDAAKAAAQAIADQESKLASAGIESVAAAHGQSQTLQDAGTALQNAARDWLNNTLPAKQAAVWDPVNSTIGSDAPTPLNVFSRALSDITSSAGKLEPLARLLRPGTPDRLKNALEGVLGTPEAEELSGGPPVVPTWGDVQKLRTILGSAMSNPATIRDVGQQNLAHLYSSITQDMRGSAAANGGPDALSAFDAANVESRRLFGIAQGPLARVIGGPTPDIRFDPAPGKIASSLLSGGRVGDSDLVALKSEGLPIGELAAAQLREDPSAWQKLSPEAQGTLIPDPNARQAVDSALALVDAAPEKARAASAAADAAHKATVADARARADFGPETAALRANAFHTSSAEDLARVRQSLLDAQDAKRAAQARFDALPRDSHLDKMLEAIQSSHIGGAAGVLLSMLKSSGLDFGDELVGGAGGELAASVAPYALRGLRAAVSSPGGLTVPLAGALGGTGLSPRRSD